MGAAGLAVRTGLDDDPYLPWVSFAAVLNYAVVRLNYPFQEI